MNGQGSVLLVLERPRADVRERLRAGSIAVTEASPTDAAPVLASAPFDVIIAPLAVLTGGLRGEALARRPPPEIVVVSPSDRLVEALALLREGASDVLAEPLDGDAAASAVAVALRRRAAAAEAALALERAAATMPARLAGSVVHELANRVAVLVSAVSAIESALTEVGAVEGLVASGGAASVAEWWQEDGRDAVLEAGEAAKEATEVTARLKTLALDLRTVLRADPASRAAFEVADAVAVALRLARPALASVARVEVSVPATATALGNAGTLARAALEILVHAAESFMRSGVRGGRVEVTWRGEPGWVVLEIRDDAPAGGERALSEAAARDAAHAFAVARDLAQRQGGSFTARRQASGGGHVVELRLPAAERPG